MDKLLIFFYGFIIFIIASTGVVYYTISTFKESQKSRINHSNYGSD